MRLKIATVLSAVCSVSVSILLPLASSHAEFECIQQLEGKQIAWDQNWQEDRRDQDVRYLVKSVEPNSRGNFTIELIAIDAAVVGQRHAIIGSQKVADVFCSRIVLAKKSTSIPTEGRNSGLGLRANPFAKTGDILEQFATTEVVATELPFRKYQYSEWLPARVPTTGELSVCREAGAVFSCLPEEAESSGAGVETGVMRRSELPLSFIRYVKPHGWRLSEPIGIDDAAMFARCRIANKEYLCLDTERREHISQLRWLAKQRSKASRTLGKVNE